MAWLYSLLGFGGLAALTAAVIYIRQWGKADIEKEDAQNEAAQSKKDAAGWSNRARDDDEFTNRLLLAAKQRDGS